MIPRWASAWTHRHALVVASSGLAVAVVLPLLAPGFVLVYDMVFVPKPSFSADLLGLSTSLPRSVPSGLFVALLSRALTGQVLQKVVLIGIFGGAAFGAGRLVPAQRQAGRVAAGALYAWNPFLYERLLLGHWALLLGYAVLPWVVGGAVAIRRAERGAAWRLALALAGAVAASPYAGAIGAAMAAAVALAPPWTSAERKALAKRALLVAGLGFAANLPWLVPAALHPPVPQKPALAVALFRARSDSPLGMVGSLISMGGLWRTDLAPPGRATLAWVPAFVLIAGGATYGWRLLRQRWPAGATAGLLGVAAAGLLLAAAPGLPGLRDADASVARFLPGGGILRDSQKFVMPLAVVLAVGFGLGVDRLLAAASRRKRAAAGHRLVASAAVLLPVLPVALAPTLAWGLGGRLSTATYPASWGVAERVMSADPVRGAVLVLPWHAYLPFGWDESRTVHQPALEYFSRRVVANSALEVGRYVIPAEDPWSRLAALVVSGRGPLGPALSRSGIRYVLLFREADWRSYPPRLERLTPVVRAPDLTLYRAPPPGRPPSFDTPPVAPVIAADIGWVALVVAGIAGALRTASQRRKGMPREEAGPD